MSSLHPADLSDAFPSNSRNKDCVECLCWPMAVIRKYKERRIVGRQTRDPDITRDVDEFLVLYDLNNHVVDLFHKYCTYNPAIAETLRYETFYQIVKQRQIQHNIHPANCDINRL